MEMLELEAGVQMEEKITERVYRATFNGRSVVTKRINPEAASIQILRSMDHESIMRIEGLVDDLLLMEDCGAIDISFCLTTVNMNSIMVQLLGACQFLHERMIRHGNINPHTIMVQGHSVKLIDFRHACFTGFCELQGTATDFSAPEISGGSATTLADMWSVGLVYYAMASQTMGWPSLYDAHILSHPIQDQRVMYAIRTCLRVEPRRRFTALMLLDFFTEVLGVQPPQPRMSQFHVAMGQLLRGEITYLASVDGVASSLDCLVAFAAGRWIWERDLTASQGLLAAWESAIDQGGRCSKPQVLMEQLLLAGKLLPFIVTRILLKLEDGLVVQYKDRIVDIVIEGMGNLTAIEPISRLMHKCHQPNIVKIIDLLSQQARSYDAAQRECDSHRQRAEGLQGYIDSIKTLVLSGI